MAQYHVGCGLAAIYAGTLNKKGDKWINKNDVTDEAVDAVIQYMFYQIPEGKDEYAIGAKLRNGKYIRLIIESADECPEWAKGLFDEEK